jgi:hypothetical protein
VNGIKMYYEGKPRELFGLAKALEAEEKKKSDGR